MDWPLVSVIIPTYNRADMLQKTVESVMRQTYSNLEIIIVNDGSKDRTSEIISELEDKDERIRGIHHRVNMGPNVARNNGILNASGEYIALIDDDDFMGRDKNRKTGGGIWFICYGN